MLAVAKKITMQCHLENFNVYIDNETTGVIFLNSLKRFLFDALNKL